MANNPHHNDTTNGSAEPTFPFIVAEYMGRQATVRRSADYHVSKNGSAEERAWLGLHTNIVF
jgi:hypothetical protein